MLLKLGIRTASGSLHRWVRRLRSYGSQVCLRHCDCLTSTVENVIVWIELDAICDPSTFYAGLFS